MGTEHRFGVVVVWAASLLLLIATVARTEIAATKIVPKPRIFARVGDQPVYGPVGSAFVLPGERVNLRAFVSSLEPRFQVVASGGQLAPTASDDQWTWTAPRGTGVYPLWIADERGGAGMRVNLFVMVPFARAKRGSLNGYAIGRYPRDAAVYGLPAGFVEVTRENADTPVSPHFRLEQFVCKQGSGYPKYVVLEPELIAKLERLLALANERGIKASTLHIMSGYRTPRYNHQLGNVRYSAHQWGRAADVFVDENDDGVMDDLNHDGRSDFRDIRILSQLAEEIDHGTRGDFNLVGGLGVYHAAEGHGPFVHVDVRGYMARWGG
jgi:hypothetical protein